MEHSGPGGTRKSPRNCVRKVKQSVKQDLLEHCAVNKSSKKRKSVSFEKEECSSDDDFECEASEPHKKVQGYRCSPHLVPELMAAMTEKQLGWVRKLDFESLGKMIDSRCPKSLVMWLVDRVDTAKGTLDVCGEEIDIRKAVKGIIGLPCGPICVPEPLNGRSKAKRSKCGNDTADEKHSDKGRGQSAKETTRRLLDENEDEVAFCQTFVMLVLCIYLAPTSSLNVNRGYMPALIDISKIPHMDWCGYIAEYLIRGIEDYKRSKSSHVQVAGCVHILPLLYLDALVKLDAIVLPEALALPDGSPRFGYIGTKHLDFLASADFKCKSKERTQYGKLQARRKNLKEQQEKSSGGMPGSNDNVAATSRFCSDGGDCVASVVEGGEAAFLDLLMEEIKGGRESFLAEIGRQMRMREEDIVNRLKLQYVKHIGLMKDKLRGAVQRASSPNNFEKGSAPECVVETGKQSERSGSVGKGTPERFVQSGNVRPQDIGISRSVIDTPVIASTVLDREFPGVETEFKSSDHEHNLGEEHFIANDRTTRIGPSTSEVRGIKTTLFEDASENLCPDVDLAAKSSIGGEQNLNRNAVSSSRSYDELTEVVGIGKEAAREASMNHVSGETHYSDDVHLSLLCETAASEMFPTYDKSPICEPDASFSTPVTASLVNFGSQVDKGELKTPVFDESPKTASMVAAMRSGKFHALLSIPEICQSEDVRDGAPTSDIRLTENKGDGGAEQRTDDTEDAVRLSDEPITLSTQRNNNSGACSSAASKESGYEDESESEEVPTAQPCILSDDEDFQFHSGSNFILTPSYTNESDQLKNAVAEPPLPPPRDIRHIPPLQKEIPNGCRFRFGCSVTSATGKLYDKFNNIELSEAGVEEAARLKFVLCQEASETYKNHVTNSSARVAKKMKGVFDPNRAKTKIQIKRFHVTKGEFFDAMKPTGEVCRNLMGLCSAAIMCDWETKKRLILDQATIMELMKPGHKCEQKKVALKLRKLNIEDVEELFLPVLIVNHWILIVVDLTAEMAYFFDSVRDVRADYHPHSALWDNLAGNLQEAYSIAMMKTVTMVMYGYTYPVTRKQTNNHDCGFHVIQGMECYKSEDVFGYAEKKTQLPYRKYLCHVLVYHRFNDLNPNREALREEAP